MTRRALVQRWHPSRVPAVVLQQDTDIRRTERLINIVHPWYLLSGNRQLFAQRVVGTTRWRYPDDRSRPRPTSSSPSGPTAITPEMP